MNQHELLTEMDRWAYRTRDTHTAELLRLAAAEIRRLDPVVVTRLPDGTHTMAANRGVQRDAEAESGL